MIYLFIGFLNGIRVVFIKRKLDGKSLEILREKWLYKGYSENTVNFIFDKKISFAIIILLGCIPNLVIFIHNLSK